MNKVNKYYHDNYDDSDEKTQELSIESDNCIIKESQEIKDTTFLSKIGCINAPLVKLRDAPTPHSTVIGILHFGTEHYISGEKDGYYQIQPVGFVDKSFIDII